MLTYSQTKRVSDRAENRNEDKTVDFVSENENEKSSIEGENMTCGVTQRRREVLGRPRISEIHERRDLTEDTECHVVEQGSHC